jgi:hypothetical protein
MHASSSLASGTIYVSCFDSNRGEGYADLCVYIRKSSEKMG